MKEFPNCQNVNDTQLTQDKPFRPQCSECGRRIKSNEKFKNFNTHAMNGIFTSTVCETCRRRISHDI